MTLALTVVGTFLVIQSVFSIYFSLSVPHYGRTSVRTPGAVTTNSFFNLTLVTSGIYDAEVLEQVRPGTAPH